MFNTSFERDDNTEEFHMFGAEKDRAPTGPQSPMPRRRRALTTEGLDSLACMERALDADTADDVKSSESKAYVMIYNGNSYQVPWNKPSPTKKTLMSVANVDSEPNGPMNDVFDHHSFPTTNPFVMEMPPVRMYASLQEAMSCPEKLKERYGRGDMSACSLVAYVEGGMDFISPLAAVDFSVNSEAGWQVIRDRVIDLLKRGENPVYVLCNEERERKGQPPIPDPKPDYTNDYGARFDNLEDIKLNDIVVVNGIGGKFEGHYVKYANNKKMLQRIPVAVVKKLRARWQDELAAKMAPKQATSDEADGEVGLFVTDDDLAVASRVPPTVFEQLQEKWKKTEFMDRDTNGNERVERRVNPEEVDVLAKEVTDKVALDAVGRAQQLIDEKKEFDASQEKEWDKLPLFHPGKTYNVSDAANGFRVMDGYEVSYNQNNDVRIATERHGVYDANKTMTVINKWSDGGLAWMYWTNKAPIGSNGVPLRECVVRYGMGGWVDKKNDRRAKVVFLDDERSVKPGRCFILAMDAPSSGNRILVKGNELNDDVFRVFRSAVPDDVQKVITLRELINVRQLAEANTTQPLSTWWQM